MWLFFSVSAYTRVWWIAQASLGLLGDQGCAFPGIPNGFSSGRGSLSLCSPAFQMTWVQLGNVLADSSSFHHAPHSQIWSTLLTHTYIRCLCRDYAPSSAFESPLTPLWERGTSHIWNLYLLNKFDFPPCNVSMSFYDLALGAHPSPPSCQVMPLSCPFPFVFLNSQYSGVPGCVIVSCFHVLVSQ